VIVAGFQGIDEAYNITTLGRGGSDTTAVALAAVMKHDPAGNGEVGCEIYTDVDGVYTTDPRIVPEARKIDVISYDEMLELATMGFTVLHNELATTLAVLRPLATELGATVEHEEEVSKVSIVGTGMRTHTGVAERMFAALSAAEVNMKMITTGDIKISVLVAREDGVKALRAVHTAFHLQEARPGAGMPAVVSRPRGGTARRSAVDDGRDPHTDTRTPIGHLASMEE